MEDQIRIDKNFTQEKWSALVRIFIGTWVITHILTIPKEPYFWINELVVGMAIIVFSISDLYYPTLWKKCVCAFIGVYMLFAPLFFWVNSAGAYNNSTLCGLLILLFSSITPFLKQIHGRKSPPGWSYNPSSWKQRIPVIVLGLIAFFVARPMASFQLEHIPTIWDPVFNEGTRTVLLSDVSKAFIISDAGLGAATYLLDCFSGIIGDSRRWRTMPWMVFTFFFLVVPAGAVSIVLIMMQPVVVGAWCFLCLITAALTLLTIPPAADEIFAAVQFLQSCRRQKKSLWKNFWFGDQSIPTADEAEVIDTSEKQSIIASAGWDGPWNLVLMAFIGIGIIVLPSIFSLTGPAANICYIGGTLLTTFSVIAFAEPVRSVRFCNWVVGLALIGGPWLINDETELLVKLILAGIGSLVVALTFPKGKIEKKYGPWTKYIY